MPRQTGERYVAGPFVDYSGTDQHIFTLSMPIVVGDGFFGVAGADVRLTELESVVIPALRSLPPDAVLVNAEGRIIASNSGRHLPGRLLVSDDARWLGEVAGQWGERADGASLARHERLPWTLVELPSRR